MNALISIFENNNYSHIDALNFVKQLQEEGRYVQELWTA